MNNERSGEFQKVADELAELAELVSPTSRRGDLDGAQVDRKTLTIHGASFLIVDWLERNRTPAHADRFLQRVGAVLQEVREFMKSPSQQLPEEPLPGLFLAAHARRTARYVQEWADEIVGAKKKPQENRLTKAKQRRKCPPRTSPTEKQQEAWLLYKRELSYKAVGERLGITATAAGKRIRAAKEIIERASRSVRASQKLPTDDRGQVST